MSSDAVAIQMGAGRASMRARNLPQRDFFNIPNAFFRFQSPVSVAATFSFDIRWSGPVTDRLHVDDPDVGFTGQFVLSEANMTWSAKGADGVSFVSDPEGTTSVFAQLGHMRNGVFFD